MESIHFIHQLINIVLLSNRPIIIIRKLSLTSIPFLFFLESKFFGLTLYLGLNLGDAIIFAKHLLDEI